MAERVVSIQPLERSRVADLLALGARNHSGVEGAGPQAPYDETVERARLERRVAECEQRTGHTWTIHVDGVLAGDIGFNHVHRGNGQSANVGYMVDVDFRGRGVATDALRLVIRESFEVLQLHRLDAGARVTNLASQRVLEKAGFRRVGVLEKHFYEDGAWRDHVLFELIGPDAPPPREPQAAP